jgi:alpha-tubulin suppressor-like RCC1 family protein
VFKSAVVDVVTGILPQVAMGGSHTCALFGNSDVRCWGKNDHGQLGLGNTNNLGDDEAITSVSPIKFPVGFKVKQIAAGFRHTCVLSDVGTVICWGNNLQGQLGYGDITKRGNTPSTTPDQLPVINISTSKVKQIISGSAASHTCAILENDAVKCWGNNADGQLGLGNENNNGDSPNEVEQNNPIELGTSVIKQLSIGENTTCALLQNTKLHCWGSDIFGKLGLNTNGSFGDDFGEAPIQQTVPLSSVTAISPGHFHSCVIVNSKVQCWGASALGQLGYGNTDTNINPKAVGFVNLGTDVKQISTGHDSTCALLINDTVKCWGAGKDGQLGYANERNIGDDDSPNNFDAVQINSDLTQGKILQIFSGIDRHCVLLESGNIKCWGINDFGQLGYGNTTNIGDTEFPSSVGIVPLF